MQARTLKWMWSALLFGTASGPLSTLITLQILEIGGGPVQVAYAISLSNVVLIPASMFWGFMADRYDRKNLIIVGFTFSTLSLLVLWIVRSIPVLDLGYAAFTFFSTSYNTPMNLLIMETTDKGRWASSFSRLSMMSSVGNLLGLIISTLAVGFLRISQIYLILSMFSTSATVLAWSYTPKSLVGVERTSMLHSLESFAVRLKMLPLIFLHIPNLHSFKMFRLNRLTRKPINYLPLLYIAITIFYVSSGLFNTLYPASLYQTGLQKSEVLGIITLGMVAQILTFYFVGHYIEGRDEREVSFRALLLRGSGYIAMGLSLLNSMTSLLLGLVFYPLSAGLAFSLYYAASNTLIFKAVGGRRQGTSLGVYSTLVGIALFTGSLVSAYISKVAGYTVDFVVAGLLLYVSALIFKYLEEG
ncbi:Major Facilitator Superfamily transporter [Metallosphaera yellowstonensis MK1]|uniref:Major Facilitator Superfamily transporter n=2 Tax=Metallosphaera TaxID=41980 RepID=H2C5D9_9CREN|nr:Major Facilitator Superfamily transporter [Metallosphaera yellowstonensis MK1]